MIDVTEKFNSTFSNKYIEAIYYNEFYSLPKFGKTKLGSLVLYAKQAQNTKLIKKISIVCHKNLLALIKKHKINAIVWTPHSLPRKIPFMNEFKKYLEINKPEFQFLKAYSGEIPIPQKSLSKLEERIENAENTMLPKENKLIFKNILIIDDAVGSGATIQAIAKKIKKINTKTKIYDYAIVGSLKGFEVLKEV